MKKQYKLVTKTSYLIYKQRNKNNRSRRIYDFIKWTQKSVMAILRSLTRLQEVPLLSKGTRQVCLAMSPSLHLFPLRKTTIIRIWIIIDYWRQFCTVAVQKWTLLIVFWLWSWGCETSSSTSNFVFRIIRDLIPWFLAFKLVRFLKLAWHRAKTWNTIVRNVQESKNSFLVLYHIGLQHSHREVCLNSLCCGNWRRRDWAPTIQAWRFIVLAFRLLLC